MLSLLYFLCLKLMEIVLRFGLKFFVIVMMIDELILFERKELIGILECM